MGARLVGRSATSIQRSSYKLMSARGAVSQKNSAMLDMADARAAPLIVDVKEQALSTYIATGRPQMISWFETANATNARTPTP